MTEERIVVFASGRGSNLQSLIDAGLAISLVISDKEDSYALKRAEEAGIQSLYLNPKDFLFKREYEKELIRVIKENGASLICLAGFMRILTGYFVDKVGLRILNIHPSLLPAFPGLHAQRQALEYGVKFSGCTVHFVDEGMDSGEIIIQATVPIFDNDDESSLAERILQEEHRIYPLAVKQVLANDYEINGRRVLKKGEGEEK